MSDFVTAISLALSWGPGRNGGSPQSFKIIYKQENTNTWETLPEISDREDEMRINYTVTNLVPETLYLIRVIALNEFGECDDPPGLHIETLGNMIYLISSGI